MAGGQVGQHRGSEKVLHRVVAQECREQRRHRRQVGDPARHVGRDALVHEAVVEGASAARAESPTIMSEKKIPIESTWAEFWKVVDHSRPGASVFGREAVHHRRPGWAT